MTDLEPVLIAGRWTAAKDPRGEFRAEDPSTGTVLAERFPVSAWEDLDAALDAAVGAAPLLARASAADLAHALELFAQGLSQHEDELVATAARETGLPDSPRLRRVELPRTIGQLRHIAELVLEGSWRQAVIDSKANLRSIYEPLAAPVVVFGPNNFPFAFNAIMGGDFASALATGNPVIGKAHPHHPLTTQLLARIALRALEASNLPAASVQLLYHFEPALGLRLVGEPRVGASAFTGSRSGGLGLKAAADSAGKPIYLELSSVNPVFVLPGALSERGPELALELASSCVLGAGQFCTNPGLSLLLEGPHAERFSQQLAAALTAAPVGVLLGADVHEGVRRGISTLAGAGAQIVVGGDPVAGAGYRFENTLLRVSGSEFLAHAAEFQSEVFGAVHLLVVAEDATTLRAIAEALHANLTACVYSAKSGADDELYEQLARVLVPKVGRFLNDKMPTGVAVSAAMHHGGPYPATGHPGFSSVGGASALRRFAALRCYDGVRPERLPEALRDRNPNGRCLRWVDGHFTTSDVPSP